MASSTTNTDVLDELFCPILAFDFRSRLLHISIPTYRHEPVIGDGI